MKIALDVDGVLADIILVWLKHYSTKYTGSVSKESITKWDFWRELGVDRYDFYLQLSGCWSDWKDVPPMEDNIAESVNVLNSLGTVDIVTARDKESTPNVIKWLEHNMIKYSDYVSVSDGREKADLGYDIFIDDSPHNAIRMISRGKNVLLYDQPWNRNVQEDGLVRIRKLAEAGETISNMSMKFGNQYKMRKFF